jgi:outer membrane lipoprotein-sorting protein
MRRILCLAVALLPAACATALADEESDLKAIIAKAIKAAGGEEKLDKFPAQTFKGKGKWYGMGDGIDYTGTWDVQRPDKLRVQIDVSAGGMNFTFIRVVNGDKVWSKFNDTTTAVDDKDEIKETKESLYVGRLTTLLPLLKEKDFKLTPLDEIKVDGKPAVGVHVFHKDHRDVNLYFDKDKGLLVKVETTVKDFMEGGKEFKQETIYGDHKEVNGLQVPMKLVINRDGKKYIDTEVTEIEPKEKLDDSVFGKP